MAQLLTTIKVVYSEKLKRKLPRSPRRAFGLSAHRFSNEWFLLLALSVVGLHLCRVTMHGFLFILCAQYQYYC